MVSILKFSPVVKDSLFYNRWRYCISFMLEEVSCLKQLDHDYIDIIIERRRYWREISQQRLLKSPAGRAARATPIIMTKRLREITEATSRNLHELADILITTNVDFKLVTSVDQAWVYANDLTLIDKLSQESELKYKVYTEAIVDRPKDTIKLKHPTHTHRSYFRTNKLTPQSKANIVNFLTSQPDIKLSPSLKTWAKDNLYRTQDYFFIEHNGESWLVMLALVNPGLIRKTLTIIS